MGHASAEIVQAKKLKDEQFVQAMISSDADAVKIFNPVAGTMHTGWQRGLKCVATCIYRSV